MGSSDPRAMLAVWFGQSQCLTLCTHFVMLHGSPAWHRGATKEWLWQRASISTSDQHQYWFNISCKTLSWLFEDCLWPATLAWRILSHSGNQKVCLLHMLDVVLSIIFMHLIACGQIAAVRLWCKPTLPVIFSILVHVFSYDLLLGPMNYGCTFLLVRIII